MRLVKFLAGAGVASRRRAEDIIRQGLVEVNGEKVILPQAPVTDEDEIKVSGKIINRPERFIYILLNKPAGYLTTMYDPQRRPTVGSLLKEMPERVYPVGRLDKDVDGVLLFTNDGELAHRLTHPGFGIPKTYFVQVRGIIPENALKNLREGIMLEEGKTGSVSIRHLRLNRRKRISSFEMTMKQGWKRQVKRMCRAVGFPVIKLERIRFAFLEVKDISPGSYRFLEPTEIKKLRKLAGL